MKGMEIREDFAVKYRKGQGVRFIFEGITM